MKSVSGVFSFIDEATDALSRVSDAIVDKIIQLIEKIFSKKGKEENKNE
jgi:hypothetical protein